MDTGVHSQSSCSLPVEGKQGKVYEIIKFVLNEDGEIASTEAVTKDSQYNNVRPYIIPGSEDSPLRLTWMFGNYYDWIVSSRYPQGYCTGIACDFKGFPLYLTSGFIVFPSR